MNQAEFALHYHSIMFRIACHEKKGSEFQAFFEKIMSKHDSTFISVRPSGRQGDWKCDGFSQATGTVYQCYAPKDLELTDTLAAEKIIKDFDGAKLKWDKKMKRWTFVWSGDGELPPQATQSLLDLKSNNADFPIDDLGREGLWKIVVSLPERDRIELLGIVPEISEATETTAAEVQTLLNYLSKQEIDVLEDNLDLTEIAEKIKKNKLTNDVQALIQTSLPVARVAQDYTKRHPDPDFQAIIANALASKYKEFALSGETDPDVIFWSIVKYVAHGGFDNPRSFWAAVGIVTLYFQLCDIFER